jgi:hypothetical protein
LTKLANCTANSGRALGYMADQPVVKALEATAHSEKFVEIQRITTS